MPEPRRILPRCRTGVGHFVSATGHYYPCCWVANATSLPGSLFETYKEQLDLGAHSIDEVLGSEVMRRLVASWEHFEDAPRPCQNHCGVVVDTDGTSTPRTARTTRENIPLSIAKPPRR
jgi:hypothetical protein